MRPRAPSPRHQHRTKGREKLTDELLLFPLLGLVLGPVQAHRPRHEDLALLEEGLVRVLGGRKFRKTAALEITCQLISHPSYGRQRQRLEERLERGIINIVRQVPAVQLAATLRLGLGLADRSVTLRLCLSSLQYMVRPRTSVSFFISTAFNAVAASANSSTPMPLNLPVSLSSIHFILRIVLTSVGKVGLDRVVVDGPREVRAEDGLDLVSICGRGRRRGGPPRGRAAAAALASFLAFFAALRAALSSTGDAPAASGLGCLAFFSFFAALRAAFSSAGDRGGVASP